jgi:hypothetical protein
MRSTVLRGFGLLLLLGSIVLLPAAAASEPPEEEPPEPGATCDADFDEYEGFVVLRGTRLECVATGLDP